MKSKRSFVYAILILCLALYLRLRYVLHTPFEFKIDAWSMYHYALNVMKGEYYGHRFGEHWARYAYWPPLYIFLSGFIYRYFGTGLDFMIMRMIHAGFSAASCLLCFLIAREAMERYSTLYMEAGLTAGILMAINPRMVVYTNHLYAETVFITIYLITVYFALRYFKCELPLRLSHTNGYTPIKYLLCYSCLLGIGNLTRPVLLLLPGVMLVFLQLWGAASSFNIKKVLRICLLDGVVTLAVMLAVFSPWVIRNYAVTGRFILIDTNGPINFYIAHNSLSNGQWVDVKPYTDINRLYETGYREGFGFICGNIPREVKLMRLKQRLFLYQGDPHILEAEQYLDRTYKLPLYGSMLNTGLELPRMSFEFLWKAAAILLILFTLRMLAAGSLHVLFSEPAWIIGNFLYVNLIIQIFYFAPRYRIIGEPFLCIIIGITLAGIFNARA